MTDAQIAALFDPLADQRELVRHYTLSDVDIAKIQHCRGDHNRLGYALMLCYLRYPGRPLHATERPPAALVAFVAEQIDVPPDAIDDYLASEQTRRVMRRNCRSDFGSALLARALPLSWPVGCCRTQSRTTGLPIWLSW